MTDNPKPESQEHLIQSAPPSINVEEIMAQVRRNVASKKKANIYKDEPWLPPGGQLHASDGAFGVDDHLVLLRSAGRLDLEGEAVKSHRPFAGMFIKAAKKFSRFWVRKYTDVLFLRQSYFNAEAIAVLTAMKKRIEELEAEVERLREEMTGDETRSRKLDRQENRQDP
jgi:hypothetical protein